MKSKLTRQQVLNLYTGLVAVSSLKGAKFAYAISRNLQLLKSQSSDFKFSDSQIQYEKKRLSAKDIKKLDKEYESTLIETQKYLDEEVQINLYIIPVSYIPEDIDAKLLSPIMAIVDENLTN